jgi:heme-degrading monooxygenase HmoA
MAKVILINAFEIQPGKEDECLAFWEKAADYMRRQPGFTPYMEVCPHYPGLYEVILT